MTEDGIDFSPLFQPITIGRTRFPSRIVMPGMQRGWNTDGRPDARLAEYYRRRAEAGAGLIITESCAIDHPSATNRQSFARINESTADAWAQCVARVKSTGGRMFMQLWHQGGQLQGDGDLDTGWPLLSPSGLVSAEEEGGRAATLDELEEVREGFVRSARLAKQIGLDGVELHGAHGFLLDEFLWPVTNRREDGYGGEDMADRVRFPAEIAAAVRAAVGPDFVIGFRMSQWKEVDYGARIARSPEELKVMLETMRGAGVDVFHVSARRFWLPEWEGSDLGIAGWVKSLIDAPVIAVGSVGLDTDVMETFSGQEVHPTGARGFGELMRRFNNHEFDMVAVGRTQIADPQFVTKLRSGRLDDIRVFSRDHLKPEHEAAAATNA